MAFEGSEEEKREHFLQTAFQIKRRVELFNCLPMEKLDHLQREIHTRQVHEHADKSQADRITSLNREFLALDL